MDNWLINLLALVLLGVVLDGARRAYLKHRDTMKVSRNLSRAMRRDMDDLEEDILSAPRPAHASERSGATAAEPRPAATPRARGAEVLAESELEYIDPEEAEKRRQIAAELPGSVRVVQRRKPEDASQVNRQVQQNFQSSRKPLAGSKPERRDADSAAVRAGARPDVPEQASLNLEEQVPMLMDSVVDTAEETSNLPSEELPQPAFDAMAGLSEEPVHSDRREPSLDESVSLESLQARDEADDDGVAEGEATPAAPKPSWSASHIKLPELNFPDLKKAVSPSREPRTAKESAKGKSASGKNSSASARKEREVEEVLILNIMAPEGDYFEGNDLLRVLLSSGLRFGDMNIFHYHCGEAGEGPALFSLANIVVPGTFDMSEMEDFATPGISLFLALPAEVEALKAFDTLLSTARNIAEQLGGELKDENRSVFTAQTAEHYRQRVMEFQRRKALARAQA